MEESRRRAYIKQQTIAWKKQEGNLPLKVMGQANPSKRKPSEKVDRPPKKPKVMTGQLLVRPPTLVSCPSSLARGRG